MSVPVLPEQPASTDAGLIRVLIIDDDVDIGDSLRDVLEAEDASIRVAVANNAVDGEKLAGEFRPDVALLDIKLGRGSGLDMVPLLKRRLPGLFCIMMTAFRDVEYAASAVRFGADDYLLKPVDPDKLLVTLREFKARKSLRDAQRAAERRFQAVFEQTLQWLLIADPAGAIVDANEVAVRYLGGDKGSLVGQSLPARLAGRLDGRTDSLFREALLKAGNGRMSRLEFSLVEGRIGEVIFASSFKPVWDDGGNLEYVVMEAHDITALKQAENSVRAVNRTLELRVRERTQELELATRRAELASAAKSEFLSRMSHELRTPLNAILGFAQLLRDDARQPLSSEHGEFVGEILTSGSKLLDLINKLLDLTRMESGKFALRVAAVDVAALVRECVPQVEDAARKRGIRLAVAAIPPGVLVKADTDRLKQVLLGLLHNAIRHNVDGGTVAVYSELRADFAVRLCVRDTGVGISPQDQARIFSAFDVVSARDGNMGAGVSLSVARQMLMLMDGTLGVESQSGEGSTFWIEIPLAGPSPQDVAPPEDSAC